jgi:hypothetical protein
MGGSPPVGRKGRGTYAVSAAVSTIRDVTIGMAATVTPARIWKGTQVVGNAV